MWQRGIIRLIREVRGSVAAMSALGLLALVGAASLAVDMGHLYTVRNEIQNTADAAALAAAGNLIKDQGGVAVRDSYGATQSAMTVAQTQSTLQGLPEVSQGDRNDVTVIFGEWNIYAGNPSTAWTEIGTTCGSYSNANAVKITLKRASGMNYGPVTNLFAGIFGGNSNTSEVQATAIAYLGYANPAGTTPPGMVEVPLAVPDTILTASRKEGASWLAQLLSPSEAIASSPHTFKFKDLGSGSFYQNNQGKPLFGQLPSDCKGYLFVVNKSDSVPGTVINNIKKNYTSGTPVRAIDYGSQLYPVSEYQWASNIKSIFQALKSAYNAKQGTYDDKYKYQNPSGKWRVWAPVYKTTNPLAQRLQEGMQYLARLLPLGVTPAHACFTFWTQTYPGGNVPIYVNGFTMVDITGVTYNANCNDCSPYTPYLNTLDCMVNNPQSCRNANSVTIEVPVDSNTIAPPGSQSGGPDNQHLTPGGAANAGALATIPKLVK